MSRLRKAAEGHPAIGTAGRKAEKKTLSKMGATPTPNSGAAGSKGDGEWSGYLLELKSTVKKSMSLKLDHLSKITGEAHAAGVEPALVIVFTDGSGTPLREGTWVCIPQATFEELTNE